MILALLMLLATPAFAGDLEFNHHQSGYLKECIYYGNGCSTCTTVDAGVLSRDSSLSCLNVMPNPANRLPPDQETLSIGGVPPSSRGAGLSSIETNALVQLLGIALRPNPYQVNSEQVTAEIQNYQNQVHKLDQDLQDRALKRAEDWKKTKPQILDQLKDLQTQFNQEFSRARSAKSHYDQTLANHRASHPTTPNPALDFLNRALHASVDLDDLNRAVPPNQMTPDAEPLVEEWTQLMMSKLPPKSTLERARIEQEKAKLSNAPTNPFQSQAKQALQYAEKYAGMPGVEANSTAGILRQEARALRHQAEGRMPNDPSAAPLTHWMDGLSDQASLSNSQVSLPSLAARHDAVAARVMDVQATLSLPSVTAQLEAQAVDFLRAQANNAQSLADQSVTLGTAGGLGRAQLAGQMMDLAYGSIQAVNDFTTGVASGVWSGFRTTPQVVQALVSSPGAFSNLINGVLYEITENPVSFIKKGLVEPFVDFCHTMTYGDAKQRGFASGVLAANTMIALALGPEAAAVNTLEMTAARVAIADSVGAEVLGATINRSLTELPTFAPLSKGILTEAAEVQAYTARHAALAALPVELQPKQILVGAIGRNEKVALIGRPMGGPGAGGVLDVESRLISKGMKVETFKWSDAAREEMKGIGTEYPNGHVPYDRYKTTIAYQDNLDWVTTRKSKGYTFLDVGVTKSNLQPSAAYDMEIYNVFGKIK